MSRSSESAAASGVASTAPTLPSTAIRLRVLCDSHITLFSIIPFSTRRDPTCRDLLARACNPPLTTSALLPTRCRPFLLEHPWHSSTTRPTRRTAGLRLRPSATNCTWTCLRTGIAPSCAPRPSHYWRPVITASLWCLVAASKQKGTLDVVSRVRHNIGAAPQHTLWPRSHPLASTQPLYNN